MGIVEDFPTDPFTPSLRFAARCQIPIWMPWAHESVKLGTSLLVPPDHTGPNKLLDTSAFSQTALHQSKLFLTSSSMGNTASAETYGSASASEHCDFSIAGQVDIAGGLLGARGRARYEKNASQSNNMAKRSFRSTYRNGFIRFLHDPALSSDAQSLLRTSVEAFERKYGSYYVAGYVLGASNASTLSGAAATAQATKSIVGSYRVEAVWGLYKSSEKSIREHERSGISVALASLSGYDSLANWDLTRNATDQTSFTEIMSIGDANRARGWALAQRLGDKTGEIGFGLGPDGLVSWDRGEDMCRAGLVIELLLLPYAGLRQYIELAMANI